MRNITWIHSLTWVEVIKRCWSIHVFRNSLILILYNSIIFTYSNIIFTYSNIHCLITSICLITIISHIVKLLLIRKFYCFRPGAHISFKYARHNHLPCPVMGEVSPLLHDVIILLYYEHWKDKQKYFYVYHLFYF